MMLNRIAVLAGHLDALLRPAIATIQQGVRGGELRHGRNEDFDGPPVDLNPDHPLIRATSLSMASAPRSRANMRTSCSSLLCSIVFGLIGLPPGLPLWPLDVIYIFVAHVESAINKKVMAYAVDLLSGASQPSSKGPDLPDRSCAT